MTARAWGLRGCGSGLCWPGMLSVSRPRSSASKHSMSGHAAFDVVRPACTPLGAPRARPRFMCTVAVDRKLGTGGRSATRRGRGCVGTSRRGRDPEWGENEAGLHTRIASRQARLLPHTAARVRNRDLSLPRELITRRHRRVILRGGRQHARLPYPMNSVHCVRSGTNNIITCTQRPHVAAHRTRFSDVGDARLLRAQSVCVAR